MMLQLFVVSAMLTLCACCVLQFGVNEEEEYSTGLAMCRGRCCSGGVEMCGIIMIHSCKSQQLHQFFAPYLLPFSPCVPVLCTAVWCG